MARANKIETCMFCGGTPCECDKPAPKPKRTPKPKAQPVEEAAPVAEVEAPPVEVAPITKPGPFANLGFVHAAEALNKIEPERATVADSRTIEANDAATTEGVAMQNILLVFGDALTKESKAVAERKVREAGLDYPEVRVKAKKWRDRNGHVE